MDVSQKRKGIEQYAASIFQPIDRQEIKRSKNQRYDILETSEERCESGTWSSENHFLDIICQHYKAREELFNLSKQFIVDSMSSGLQERGGDDEIQELKTEQINSLFYDGGESVFSRKNRAMFIPDNGMLSSVLRTSTPVLRQIEHTDYESDRLSDSSDNDSNLSKTF